MTWFTEGSKADKIQEAVYLIFKDDEMKQENLRANVNCK